MKKDWLKDKMNERFEDFDSGLDLEQAWVDLDKRRKPQKKDRKFIIFWIGLALIGFTLLGLYLKAPPSKITGVDLKDQKDIVNLQNLEKEENEMVVRELNETKAKVQEISLEMDQSNNSNVAKSNLETKEKSIRKKSSKSSRLTDNTGIIFKKHGQEMNSVPFRKSTNTPELSVQPISPTKARASVETSKRSDLSVEMISLLPTLMNQSITGEARSIITVDAILMKLPKSQIPIVKNSRNSFGVSIAYGWHNRQLDILGVDSLGFVSAKKNQEKTLDAIAASLFYRKYFADDFFAEIGLGFQQTTYEFKDQKVTEEKQSIDDQIIAIHNYPDGSKETIFGTLEQTETRVRDNTFYQKFRQIHVNVIVGKELDLSPTFGLGISGGLEYGVFTQAKGVSFSNTLDFRNYGDLSELKYKENGMLSGLLRIELLKGLNARSELGIALIGKTSLGNLFAYNGIIEKRNYLMSRFSYTYRF